MGLFIRFLAITAVLSSTVVGQSAGPSPTASVGCEPHGDHWFVQTYILLLLPRHFINAVLTGTVTAPRPPLFPLWYRQQVELRQQVTLRQQVRL